MLQVHQSVEQKSENDGGANERKGQADNRPRNSSYLSLSDFHRNFCRFSAGIVNRCSGVQYDSIYSFIHSFIQTIPIAPFQVHYYSEALSTQHGYCAGISRRSATSNCEVRTCPRSLYTWRPERKSNP